MFLNYNENDTTLMPETPLHNTALCLYFERQLLNLILAQFDCEGVPEEWDYDYLMSTLFMRGGVLISDFKKYGVIPQKCSLSGINVFGKPSRFIVTNPLFTTTVEGKLHKDGVYVKLFPDYGGYHTTIRAYASRIACAMEAVDVAICNGKPTVVMWADNQKNAVTLKRGVSDAMRCKPYVVLDKGLGKDSIGMLQPDMQRNFLAPALLDVIDSLLNKFKDSVGVFHQNNDKKANLLQSEVNNSQAQVTNQLAMVVDCVNRGFDEANKKYGLALRLKPRLDASSMASETVEDTEDADIRG